MFQQFLWQITSHTCSPIVQSLGCRKNELFPEWTSSRNSQWNFQRTQICLFFKYIMNIFPSFRFFASTQDDSNFFPLRAASGWMVQAANLWQLFISAWHTSNQIFTSPDDVSPGSVQVSLKATFSMRCWGKASEWENLIYFFVSMRCYQMVLSQMVLHKFSLWLNLLEHLWRWEGYNINRVSCCWWEGDTTIDTARREAPFGFLRADKNKSNLLSHAKRPKINFDSTTFFFHDSGY